MTPQEELALLEELERLEAEESATPGKEDTTSWVTDEMSTTDKLISGIGSGLTDIGRKATNLVLPESMTPDWAGDEAIAEQKALDEQLGETGAGMAGQILGETAALLPTGAIGGAARAASAGARVLPAIAEGAAQGVIAANPEDRTMGGVIGGGLGGTMGALGRGGRRATEGIVRDSPEALELTRELGKRGQNVKLPLSERAGGGDALSNIVGWGYREVLPYLPGTRRVASAQADEAADAFRRAAMKDAMPEGFAPSQLAAESTSPQHMVRELGEHFTKEYDDTLRMHAFNVRPDDVDDMIVPRLKHRGLGKKSKEKVTNWINRYVADNGKKGVLEGADITVLKSRLMDKGRQVGQKNKDLGQTYYEAAMSLDDIVARDLRHGASPENLADLARYQALSTPYRNFKVLEKATGKAKGTEGRFTAQELRNAGRRATSVGKSAVGDAPYGKLAELGMKTVDSAADRPGLYGRAAIMQSLLRPTAGGAGLATAGALTGGIPGMALAIGGGYLGGKAALSRRLQHALLGDTWTQHGMQQFLKSNPDLMRILGTTLRAGAVGQATGD